MIKQNKEIPPDILKFAPLTKYSWRKRLIIYLADLFFYTAIMLIGRTVRFEFEGWKDSKIEGWESYEIAYAKKPATINAFWHDRIFLMTYFWRKHGVTIMVSQSFDGEYIARTAQRFGYGVIRGSSTRGGSNALKKMLKLLRKGIWMVFTVDGPVGPRYKAKKGTILLAKQTGIPIIPISIEAKNYWTINTWDKLQIPKPFTRAKVFVGEPVFVSKDIDKKNIENKRREVQIKLDELVEIGQQWRDSK